MIPAFALVLVAIIAGAAARANAAPAITVFAAASLKNALDDVNAAFTKASSAQVVASYAASSALIRQIEQGAPADVFFSADVDWMDYGSRHKLVSSETRVDLLGNRLVLIAAKSAAIDKVIMAPGVDLAKLAGSGRIVTGNVDAVPIGRYAKRALENLGAWATIENRIAMVDNVRVALLLVAREEAALGIVYETDARVEPNVKIVGVFPPDSHPPIIYPAALTATAQPEAARYLAFLTSREAKAIFEAHGFTFLLKPTP